MLNLPATSYNATVVLLAPGAKADTAAATSSWVAISAYDGPLIVVSSTGTVTAGQIAAKVRTATDGSGTGARDVHTFTVVTTSNDPKTEVAVINSDACDGYIAYVGTITTGPVDLGVIMLACSQYA